MTKNAVVLGCGMIGETMARDLAADDGFAVTVADVSEDNLARLAEFGRIETRCADLTDEPTLRSVVEQADVVLGALPSVFGFRTLEIIIDAGKNFCDISFMPENALDLDARAKARGVTAVVDCGVSPGLSNLFVGHAYAKLDSADRAVIMVGGLPKVRRWPYDYKAPFAPSDVIEEYTRPARLIENGQVVTKPALSEPEFVDFPRVGTLEAFNTDGLRTLLDTMAIPFMKEKTLRYPGHIDLMRALRETGLFDKNEIEVKGVRVRPLDVTSSLLFPRWRLERGEEEFTVLRVVVDGLANGCRTRFSYDLYDEYDKPNGMSSMARTTAFPATIMARAVASGRLSQAGVLPLERLAPDEPLYDWMMGELASRGVDVQFTVEKPEP